MPRDCTSASIVWKGENSLRILQCRHEIIDGFNYKSISSCQLLLFVWHGQLKNMVMVRLDMRTFPVRAFDAFGRDEKANSVTHRQFCRAIYGKVGLRGKGQ